MNEKKNKIAPRLGFQKGDTVSWGNKIESLKELETNKIINKMKKVIFVMMMAMLFGFTSNQVFAQKKGNEVVCYKSNMDCANCEKTITEYLKFEKGVKNLKVDHVSNTILVEYKKGKNTEDGFAKAIQKKGYKADKITTEQYKKIITESTEHVHEHGVEVHRERK